MSYDLLEAVGGPNVLQDMMDEFYRRMANDAMIGFFFSRSDLNALATSQAEYLLAHLGNRTATWRGPSIRKAHQSLPILPGHFDRRHQILTDVLEVFQIPEWLKEDWLAFDQSLRPLVLRMGESRREAILKTTPEDSPQDP